MASSLFRFSNQRSSNGKKLYWSRAEVDGVPFRGGYAPLIPEAEYDNRVCRVSDTQNGFFDVTNRHENDKYLDVINRCLAGWYRLLHLERFWQGTSKHYVEWAEYYMEDGGKTPFTTSGVMEVERGETRKYSEVD